jgi:hypothetical protein
VGFLGWGVEGWMSMKERKEEVMDEPGDSLKVLKE